MDTSDDFLTGGGGVDIPTKQAENISRTAERVDTGSESARRERERRRRAASTAGRPPAPLGVPGLLGLNPNDIGGARR